MGSRPVEIKNVVQVSYDHFNQQEYLSGINQFVYITKENDKLIKNKIHLTKDIQIAITDN